MARLVDVDEAKAKIIAFSTECNSTILPIDAILMILNQIDTVDTVPVVRCLDCKHMIPQSHTRYCTVWNAVNGMGDDGFCNYGERKDDGSDGL